MSFDVGSVVKIERRPGGYEVKAREAAEGGGWGLTLMPLQPPYLATREFVYPHKDGEYYTEQLASIDRMYQVEHKRMRDVAKALGIAESTVRYVVEQE